MTRSSLKTLSAFAIAAGSLFAVACSNGEKSFTIQSFSPVASVPSTSPLFYDVSSKWEGSLSLIERDNDYIAAGTPGVPANYKTKTISIPQTDLYYSELVFTIGTNSPATCAQVKFQPYYYRKSNSNAFVGGQGMASVDCSTVPPSDSSCYGGVAAVQTAAGGFITNILVDKFVYILPYVAASQSYTVKSANELEQTETPGQVILEYSNNTFASNNASLPGALVSSTSGATSNGYVNYIGTGVTAQDPNYSDYIVQCIDDSGVVLYQLTFIINPTHDTPTTDCEFYDWNFATASVKCPVP